MNFRVDFDGECRCENEIEYAGASQENPRHQNSVSIKHLEIPKLEDIRPSGCHHCFGDRCKIWFVKEMQDLESKTYKCFKESKPEDPIDEREEKCFKKCKKTLNM